MTQIDELKLMAFVDDELSEDEAQEIREMIANDPVLLAQVEEIQALRGTLNAAIDASITHPPPDHLMKTLRTSAPVAEFSRASNSHAMQNQRTIANWFRPAAMAASVAALAIAGTLLLRPAPEGMTLPDNTLVALNTVGDDGVADGTAIAESYLDTNGRLCRSFTLTDSDHHGLACRNTPEDWQLVVLVSIPTDQAYLPAGADTLLEAFTSGMQPLEDGMEQAYLSREE